MASDIQPSPRYHSLDALRAVAMLLGIFVHATHSFFIPFWCGVQDISSSMIPAYIYFFFHQFRLHTFFVVAGFFGRMLYHRDGAIKLLKTRFKRIYVPFLIGLATLLPLMSAVQIYGRAKKNDPNALIPWHEYVPYFTSSKFWDQYTTHYLWFLNYLMMFYVFIIGLRYVILKFEEKYHLRRKADQWMEYICIRRKAPLILAIPTLFVMSLMSGPMVDEPGFSILPQIGPFLFYYMFFMFGWMLHRNTERLNDLKKHWRSHLIGGILIYLPIGIAAGIMISKMAQPNDPPAISQADQSSISIESANSSIDSATGELIASISNAASTDIEASSTSINKASAETSLTDGPPDPPEFEMTWPLFAGFTILRLILAYLMWTLTLAMIGIFLCFFEWRNPLFRYIADSSYWLYIAHAPLLMYIQIEIAYWVAPWPLKLIVILTITLALLWLSYHFLVRSTFIGKILNGRRYPMKLPWRIYDE